MDIEPDAISFSVNYGEVDGSHIWEDATRDAYEMAIRNRWFDGPSYDDLLPDISLASIGREIIDSALHQLMLVRIGLTMWWLAGVKRLQFLRSACARA